MARESQYWYWLVCADPETGKHFLVAGGRTEDEARQKGMEVLGGVDFQIKRLPTRNLARASSLLKGNRLESTHSLKQASERLGHDRSLRRRRRKQDPLAGWP